MKTFIFIFYVIFILVIPQLYTWLVRTFKDDNETNTGVIILGGLISILITVGFTLLLIQWQIISITL